MKDVRPSMSAYETALETYRTCAETSVNRVREILSIDTESSENDSARRFQELSKAISVVSTAFRAHLAEQIAQIEDARGVELRKMKTQIAALEGAKQCIARATEVIKSRLGNVNSNDGQRDGERLDSASLPELVDYACLLTLAKIQALQRFRWLTSNVAANCAKMRITPPSLERLVRLKRSRTFAWLAGFVGLILAGVGFWPPAGLVAGVVGLVWFFVEKRWLPPRELNDLKKEGRFVKDLAEQIGRRINELEELRNVDQHVRSARIELPPSVGAIIERILEGKRAPKEELERALMNLRGSSQSVSLLNHESI